MSPEVILKLPHNHKCDIWSIGCVMYELLTGKILFDPSKTRRFNRDRQHINCIMNILGNIPDKFKNKIKNKSKFFKKISYKLMIK